MTHHSLIPIIDHTCHCGNVTATGCWRKYAPTPQSKQLCCLACRCDTHTNFSTFESDCGPFCIYHEDDLRNARMNRAIADADQPLMLKGQKWEEVVESLVIELGAA